MTRWQSALTVVVGALACACGRTLRATDSAEAPNGFEAHQLSATHAIAIRDLAISADGRVGIGGYYLGQTRFDDARLELDEATSEDGFLALLDEHSEPLWTKPVPGFGAQGVTGTAFAPSGELVVQGVSDARQDASFRDAADSAFVARYDTDGDVTQRQGFAGDHTFASKVAVDSSGAALLVGDFSGQLDFYGPQDLGPPYVIKLEADGTLDWIRSVPVAAGAKNLAHLSVAVASDDAVVVGGDFGGDGHALRTGFVTKLTSGGETLYSSLIAGGLADVSLSGVAVDASGAVIAAGDVWGELELGEQVVKESSLTFGAWVARFDAEGKVQWAKGFEGGEHGASASCLAVDGDGIVIAGTADAFTSGDEVELPRAPGARLVFAARLDESGELAWLRHTDAIAAAVSRVAIAPDHAVWLAGEFSEAFDFGRGLSHARGSTDAFLLRLAAP